MTKVSVSFNHLYHVLEFLRVAPTSFNWISLIVNPIRRANSSVGKARLVRLLAQFLLKHSKTTVAKFPKVEKTETLLPFTLHERTQHNLLATVVKANSCLIAIGEQGKKMSVRANRKRAEEMLSNFRLALGVMLPSDSFRLELSEHNRLETRELVKNEDQVARERVEDFMRRCVAGELSECPKCKNNFVLQLIYPCGHCLCPFCFDPSVETVECRECGRKADGNEFAWLQPGFEIRISNPVYV